MFGIDQQLARLETLTCEMSRKLDAMINLLQKLANQQQHPSNSNSYTVTISEDQWREWQGQEGQDAKDD